jgi:hypothetical protein
MKAIRTLFIMILTAGLTAASLPSNGNASGSVEWGIRQDAPPSPGAGSGVLDNVLFFPMLERQVVRPDATTLRPYSPDSIWNTPIDSHPNYDPHSADMISTIGLDYNGKITSNPLDYSYTVYFVDSTTPRWNIPCDSNNCTIVRQEGVSKTTVLENVPIPPEARPAGGTDAAMIVINRETLDEYNFLGVVRTATGWAIDNGSLYNLSFNGTPPKYSSRGAGVPYYAGLIRPWEIEQGKIEHVIGFAYSFPASDRCVYPASKTDGSSNLPYSIPQGARLQLDPSLTDADFNQMGLSATGKIIARALQEYGMILVNVSGRPKIYVENLDDNPLATYQWGDPPYFLTATTISGIPYTSFRVLALPQAYWDPNAPIMLHGKCLR